jgi:outer membrane immunogenic protein
MFLPNWSAKVEYKYYDLGSVTTGVPLVSSAFPGANALYGFTQAKTRFNGSAVTVGINYHFNWGAAPVVARY